MSKDYIEELEYIANELSGHLQVLIQGEYYGFGPDEIEKTKVEAMKSVDRLSKFYSDNTNDGFYP